MSPVVAEASLVARLADAAPPGVVAVPRSRGRRGWRPIDGDDVVAALSAAGPEAIVAARAAAADPGAALLRRLAAAAGHEVVTLPDDPDAAAWTVAVAARAEGRGSPPAARRLQALAGLAAAAPPTIPRRDRGTAGAPLPALRPAVLARWADCAWRPCPRCGGGGLPGAPCGRCSAPLPAGAAA